MFLDRMDRMTTTFSGGQDGRSPWIRLESLMHSKEEAQRIDLCASGLPA